MNARDEVLTRLRAARPSGAVTVSRDYDPPAPDGTDLVELLTDRLLDYRATVRRCDAAALPTVLASLLTDASVVVVPPGLPSAWLGGTDVAQLTDDGGLTPGQLDLPGAVVVTGCAIACARTGTIILDAGPDQGRRVLTLVPDRHICVVRVDQVVYGIPEALSRLTDPTRPLTMISGPSATSDIELNRVEGVHGPRHLTIILLLP
ncbi:L-lactate dehydrogenase complex protein LldG [Allocatelliglobosispora scoriae]|uniref:L-lactate dehydrogenase complex protein LldG n=1 Tax=Allocatelliglobosispora scoriae TaxID=643052 RepID=A0A841BQL3_9ACTN|nr:LUD domain-containing protein [Allocatelliglobosispora scoriae]MBB5869111.1 L-lactate dehydrogenase complex protein LldG [Allocatelliglobosispora scoriae]